MAASSSSKKLLLLRKPLCRALKPNFSPSPSSSIIRRSFLSYSSSSTHSKYLLEPSVTISKSFLSELSRSYCSHSSPLPDASQGPAAIDYRSLLQEDEYHRLANATIHGLLDKLEEYGDSVDIDGFDVDYGNEVLTLKLGDLGTYVINKQTPNRQIWMSSPVSGPSRFDWDQNSQGWIYRRTKANLRTVLEDELEKLCGSAINLS
ncbi:PREDICTED: frataxin, mitochondrial [Nicotiana attenuata]|uniref:ferroxidase n=1 Tax=Nicotiana attenuata TaxID=49451 RepID=A0A1J6K2U1_NICAT|nr:PREDICTED: frataxin, mitochondrial [Nicotiana attenuata]OIT19440.1 frataxin, mitochondrial [Nicotiana attenuata]